MATLDKIRIKRFDFAALKEYECFALFLCLFAVCSASVNALHIVLVTVRMEALQNGRLVRFAKRTDCWCAFSWSV